MILKPFSATAIAFSDETQTLPNFEYYFIVRGERTKQDPHDHRIVGKCDIVRKDHLLPDNRRFPHAFNRRVRIHNKVAECLLECLTLRSELCLGLVVLSITIGIDLVAAGAKVLAGEGCKYRLEELGSEIAHSGSRQTELTRRRLIGKVGPRGCIEACNILGVRASNCSSMARSVYL